MPVLKLLLPVAFALVSLTAAQAQAIPAVAPRAAPATPAPSNTPPPGAPNMVTLQYPNSDVQDVLHLYESLTGKRFVMDNNVQGKVNIFVAKPIPREEAVKMIEMNLLMNGYSLVPAEGDVVKVISGTKNPRGAGIPIISDIADIPPGEHVVSFLFKLRFADPSELQQALGQYVSPPQNYTSFVPLPKAGAILVTESTSVLKMLAKIIEQIDVAPAEVVSEFIKLERADASKVVETLKDIFEKGQQPSGPVGPGGVRAVRAQNGIPNVPQPVVANDDGGFSGLTEDSVIVGKIKVEPDVRTNRIHVITRPINMPFVRKLIAELDANVEFGKPVSRSLRYISAGDVLPVLVQALSEPGSNQQGGEGAPGGANPNGAPGAQQPQRRSNSASTNSSTNSQSNIGGGSGGEGGSLNVSEELSTQPVDTAPRAVTVGNSKLIADQRSNSIIVLGSKEVVVKIGKILDEMDVKAPQVAITTVIGELSLNNDEEFGVDYFLKYRNKAVGISRNTGIEIGLPSASPVTTIGGSPAPGILDPAGIINFSNLLRAAGAGTNVYVAAGNYLAAAVHLLESTGRFRVISRPMVFTSNNKKAIIASGQEIPVPVSTLSNATTSAGVASVQSSIQFKKVALQLEVVPLINSENEVSLDILQKIDSVVANSGSNIGGNTVPTIATRYIKSNVSAANGCTIVLGGLIQDNKGVTKSGIPILDRLPLVGGLFRNTVNTKTRQELIILMRPEVTLTKLEMMKLRQKMEEKTHFGPEIDQNDCPDCPPSSGDDKQLARPLPSPEFPSIK